MKKNYASYPFTLILKKVDEHTPGLEDALYESGCDDALINFRNGAVFLDFDRKASSLEEAVLLAIKQVEASSIGAQVMSVAPEDWVSMSELAKRLNKTRQIIFLWIKQERRKSALAPFPKPGMKLADKSPLWKWREVVEWLYFHQLITEKALMEQAAFLENINVVLELRDQATQQSRKALLEKLQKGY